MGPGCVCCWLYCMQNCEPSFCWWFGDLCFRKYDPSGLTGHQLWRVCQSVSLTDTHTQAHMRMHTYEHTSLCMCVHSHACTYTHTHFSLSYNLCVCVWLTLKKISVIVYWHSLIFLLQFNSSKSAEGLLLELLWDMAPFLWRRRKKMCSIVNILSLCHRSCLTQRKDTWRMTRSRWRFMS